MNVLVTKPGTLTDADKEALRTAGIVPIEADDPANVKLIQMEGPEISASDLFRAAMRGVAAHGASKTAFADAVAAFALKGTTHERD